MRPPGIDDLRSRYASCTPGVIDRCVRAVACEGGLGNVIPGWAPLEVALVARDALEAFEAQGQIRDDLERRDVRASDWVLTVVAEWRHAVAQIARDRKDAARSAALEELASNALEAVAASTDRSPILWYEDIYYEAAQSLVRRRDPAGITRQIECVAETLRNEVGTNAVGTMRDLALVYLDFGEHRRGLTLLTELHRQGAANIWSYNASAIHLAHYGLPSLARLAAERGLELIRQRGDEEGLTQQLTGAFKEAAKAEDRSDAPAEAVEALRDALRAGFDETPPIPPRDLARQLVPDVATARIKELSPMPTADVLAETAARLRAVLRKESTFGEATLIRERSGVTMPIASVGTKVGRNDPCPCASGKKHKRCCLGTNAS